MTQAGQQEAETPTPKNRRAWLRVGLLVGLVVALMAGGYALGGPAAFTPERLRAMGQDAGPFGALVFIVVWCVADLAQAPSAVFGATAIGLYGPILGGVLTWLGSLAVLSVGFAMIRSVGGSPLADHPNRHVRRGLHLVETRPILALALLRSVLLLSPFISYPVVLAGVRYRDYMVGSAIGLAPPIAVGTTVVAMGLSIG